VSDADLALIVAFASLAMAGIVHFASVRRDDDAEERAVKRENKWRADQAREAAITEVVRNYNALRNERVAGANLDTVRDAGIALLENDADVRIAIDRMGANGEDPLRAFRNNPVIQDLDLARVFRYSRDHGGTVESAIEAVFRANADKN